jgi:hypothetical protein
LRSRAEIGARFCAHSDLGDYAVGAHPDELEPISRQEADELSRLVMSIVEHLYVSCRPV